MRGLLYDVHGNLPALEAVLEDAADVDRWLLGGDYTLFGAWPDATLDRLRALDATWIRGNGERWTATPADAPEPVRAAISWCAGMLGRDVVAEMAALPETHREGTTLFCHGSPGSDVESFLPEEQPGEDELLEGVDAELVVFGHTHLPFAPRGRVGHRAGEPGQRGHALRRRPPRGVRGAARRRPRRAPARGLRPPGQRGRRARRARPRGRSARDPDRAGERPGRLKPGSGFYNC